MNPTPKDIYDLVLAAVSSTPVRPPGSDERVKLGGGDCARIAKEAERLFAAKFGAAASG